MKLKTLIIENIGPYKGNHTINFCDIKNSLYLITGPTGAGKSFIFDTICYALYGKTSGDNREANDFKSKFAGPDDLASVELEFEYHNKCYKIRREPKQTKRSSKKTNGEYKEIEVVPKATLVLPNGDIIEKTKDVDSKLEDIIGLDYDQFKMTMMIAQGDFYSLINADTKEREAIFRRILNTGKLNDFTDKLAVRYKDCKGELEGIKKEINTYRNSFELEGELEEKVKNENELISSILPLIKAEVEKEEKELKTLQAEVKKSLDLSTKANNAYNDAKRDNENYDAYSSEKEKNDKLKQEEEANKEKEKKVELAEKANKVIEANKLFDDANIRLQQTSDKIKKDNDELSNAKDTLDKSEEAKKEIPSLEEENKKIIAETTKLNKNLEDLNEYNVKEEKLGEIETKLKKQQKDLNTYSEKLGKIEAILKEESVDGKLTESKLALKTLEEEVERIKNLKDTIKNYLLAYEEHAKATEDLADKQKASESSRLQANKYKLLYHQSIAGILAKDLIEGSPCPVCGSTQHPELACLKEEISKEMLDEYEKKADETSAALKGSESNVNNYLMNVRTNEEKIKVFIHEFNYGNVEGLYNDLLINKNIAKDSANTEFNKLKSKKEEQDNAHQQKKTLDETINSIKEKMSGLNKDRAEIKGFLDSKQELAGLNKKELSQQIADLQEKSNNNEKTINELNKSYNKAKEIVTSLITSIKTNSETLKQNEVDQAKAKANLDKVLKENSYKSVEEAQKNYITEDDLFELKIKIEDFKAKLNRSNTLLENYKKNKYDKLEKKDLDFLKKQKDEASENYEKLNNKCINYTSKYNNNSKAYKALFEKNNSFDNKTSEYNEIEALYNVASGKVSGNKKINFEVYYQRQVFGEILKVACAKFYHMTDGRYELLEGKPKGGNTQIGLEIDVKDIYNGECRPVSSLSGGESFQASMSLALAFSEIVQAKAGGVELNSMFIDEGFGTLDKEMLDTTKKTLLQIGSETNRSIGIISHIEELENSIPSKIVVEKSVKGSSFRIVND